MPIRSILPETCLLSGKCLKSEYREARALFQIEVKQISIDRYIAINQLISYWICYLYEDKASMKTSN